MGAESQLKTARDAGPGGARRCSGAAIFGQRNVVYTRNLTNLPLELSMVYARLAS